MVDDGLLWEVTIDVVLGELAFSFVRLVGVTAAGAFHFPGIVLYGLFYIVALVLGAYFVVRGLGKLVEDVVRQEITHRS